MEKNIDIIFVDIDWTILSHYNQKHVFDKASIRALKKAQKRGVLVYLCTARAYHSVVYTGLLDIFKPDGMIISNGGLVLVNDKVIKEINFTEKNYNKMCEMAIKLNLTLQITTERSAFFVNEKSKYVDYVYAIYQEAVPNVEDYHGKKGINAVIFAPKEADEDIRKHLPKDMTMFRYYDYAIELIEKEHIKGEGINAVLDYLHLSKDRVMTIGDDIQDVSMFENSKYSVCMANGKEEAKTAASYITPPIEKHGVKKALKHFKVI